MKLYEKLQELGFKSYDDYLNSKHWKEFSISVKESTCYCCGRGGIIQVHHIHYDNLGKELPEDVVSVCSGCHLDIHDKSKNRRHIPLNQLHEIVRAEKIALQTKNWCQLENLITLGYHSNLIELQTFLTKKKLFKIRCGTGLGYELGYTQRIKDVELWHKERYCTLCKNDQKLQGKIIRGSMILPWVYKAALEPIPESSYEAYRQLEEKGQFKETPRSKKRRERRERRQKRKRKYTK